MISLFCVSSIIRTLMRRSQKKSVVQKAMHCSLLLVKVFNAQRDHNFRICQKSLSGKKRRSGAHSKKTLFIGRSFIKSIDRSVEKSNNSIIDHLVCQAKLLLQYYQDFYSIWKSRSRWTTQRSAIGEELLFVLKPSYFFQKNGQTFMLSYRTIHSGTSYDLRSYFVEDKM